MDKKFLVLLIPSILVIAIFGIFAMFNQLVTTPTITQDIGGMGSACIRVLRADGSIEDKGCSHNVYTNTGKNATRDILAYQIYYGNFSYIGLCNVTAGCTADATDTTLDNEYASGGLSRTAGTVNTIPSSPGNWTVYRSFTATVNNLVTNMTGLFNQSSGGTLMAVVLFPQVSLNTDDQLQVNWTNTAT